MVRQDLIDVLTEAFPGITRQDMLTIVEALFESMAQSLIRGETVELRGLGRFTVKERRPVQDRRARAGPQTLGRPF